MAPLYVQVFWRGANARKNDDHRGRMGWGKISRWLKLPYSTRWFQKPLGDPFLPEAPLKKCRYGCVCSRFWGNPVSKFWGHPKLNTHMGRTQRSLLAYTPGFGAWTQFLMVEVQSQVFMMKSHLGLSENVGYIPNEIPIFKNEIMISKTIGFRGTNLFSDTPKMAVFYNTHYRSYNTHYNPPKVGL